MEYIYSTNIISPEILKINYFKIKIKPSGQPQMCQRCSWHLFYSQTLYHLSILGTIFCGVYILHGLVSLRVNSCQWKSYLIEILYIAVFLSFLLRKPLPNNRELYFHAVCRKVHTIHVVLIKGKSYQSSKVIKEGITLKLKVVG